MSDCSEKGMPFYLQLLTTDIPLKMSVISILLFWPLDSHDHNLGNPAALQNSLLFLKSCRRSWGTTEERGRGECVCAYSFLRERPHLHHMNG